jgi:hypothetical protein
MKVLGRNRPSLPVGSREKFARRSHNFGTSNDVIEINTHAWLACLQSGDGGRFFLINCRWRCSTGASVEIGWRLTKRWSKTESRTDGAAKDSRA